jgi:hypothetical protein
MEVVSEYLFLKLGGRRGIGFPNLVFLVGELWFIFEF